jgi:hypothetical protein
METGEQWLGQLTGRFESFKVDIHSNFIRGISSYHMEDGLFPTRMIRDPGIDFDDRSVENEDLATLGNERLNLSAREDLVLPVLVG